MNRSKRGAFDREFTFFEEFLRRHGLRWNLVDMKVERVDSELLSSRRNSEELCDYAALPYISRDEIFFLDEQGVVRGRVGYGVCFRNPNYFWWKLWSNEPEWLTEKPDSQTECKLREVAYNETVGEAISRLGIMESAYYILRVVVGIERNKDNDTLFFVHYLTLHKPPKSFTLAEWLAGEVDRETGTLRGQVSEIDSVQ